MLLLLQELKLEMCLFYKKLNLMLLQFIIHIYIYTYNVHTSQPNINYSIKGNSNNKSISSKFFVIKKYKYNKNETNKIIHHSTHNTS